MQDEGAERKKVADAIKARMDDMSTALEQVDKLMLTKASNEAVEEQRAELQRQIEASMFDYRGCGPLTCSACCCNWLLKANSMS